MFAGNRFVVSWGMLLLLPGLAAAQQSFAPASGPGLRDAGTVLVQGAPLLSPGVSMLPPGGGGISGGAAGAPPAAGRSLPQSQSLAPNISVPLPGAAPSLGAGGGTAIPLTLIARYGREFPAPIGSGLVWRIFPARPDPSGTFRALKEEKGGSSVIALPPGDYVVHVSFGLASAARAVHLRDASRELFDLPAGGIRLEGRVGDVKIPGNHVSFDIYKGSQFEGGAKSPLVQGVPTGDVVVVPEGLYYIVSSYGDTNAVVRSDIRVQSGKLTDVTVSHRAAMITLKLVSERGGEARANTTWSVITPGGDIIKESTGAFPSVILAEGEYHAIARNDGRTFERDFKVIAGVDGEVEVIGR